VARLLSWIIVIPLGAAVIALTVSNRAAVAVDLWPLPLAFEAPLFAVIMSGAIAGFLAGAVVAWLSGGGTRSRARQLTRQLESSKREEAYLKEQIRKAEAEAEARDKAQAPEVPAASALPGPSTPPAVLPRGDTA